MQRRRIKPLAAAVLAPMLLQLAACSTEAPEPAPSTSAEPALLVAPTFTPEEADLFAEGNLYFLAYHELGHAVIAEFGLPVTGREEDAVDRLATWMMTPYKEEEEAPEYLMAAITGWFAMAERDADAPIVWWDEHGTSEQRGYQVACLLYGSDPPQFKEVADALELPEERRESCAEEYKQNDATWAKLVEPIIYAPGAGPAPADSVTVRLAPTESFAAERAFVEQTEVLQDLHRLLTTHFRFKPGVTLSAEQCGEPNAFWTTETRKMTICYELVRELRRMGLGGEPVTATAAPVPG
jgi:hypothetical protein